MSSPATSTALCAALPIPAAAEGVPEWIHLLPAGAITTVDGRGPYRVKDADGLIAASMPAGARLVLDENHSTDLAAPRGDSAPARGWITAMQSREDGIWGQVEWTEAGRQLVADKAYRNISPAIRHLQDGTVIGVLRASLVNMANLRGLAALHQQQEQSMDFIAKLRASLGLKDDADEAAVLGAVEAQKGQITTHAAQITTHAAQLAPIARAAGLKEDADGTAVLQAVQELADPAKRVPADAVTALQGQLTALQNSVTKKEAETAVDAAIKAGKIAAPQVMRDHYIARHMADPASVAKEFEAMPSLHGQRLPIGGAPPKPGEAALDPDEAKAIALMGIDPEAYRKTKATQAEREGAL